ncbi:MAG: sigma-54-dependent Fis family transcriptional regulator [Clostridia bacterium]|nr:sigma-54-dependent Fis family transcriptional regulator [Clostridia bacterium]
MGKKDEGVVGMDALEQLRLVADIADEGIIGVDRKGFITLFNRGAKEITGIILNNSLAHPAGAVKQGDIVLLADSMLGGDDGDLGMEDLGTLGIRDERLEPGDAVLAVGVYQNIEIDPLYRSWKPQAAGRELRLEGNYLGLAVSLVIDRNEKEISVTVNGVTYRMRYLRSISNLVVVDGATGSVKFFQEKGYTMRKEDVCNILRGREYQAKGEGVSEFNVLGANFFDLVQPCDLTRRLTQILSGESGAAMDEPFDLNYRLMQTSICPMVQDGEVEGALLKVIDLSDMGGLLKKRNELIAQAEETGQSLEGFHLRVPPGSFGGFAGSSAVVQQVKYLAYRAAKARCNVIITGESGTGKSQLAKEIHELSRPGRPFVEVNCGSISPGIFESELFGYVGGAFTGALSGGKAGYLEQAECGTIFLDELGEIPPDIQVKLLYVLQNKRFYRVGSTKAIDADVRILCATNRDLRKEVKEGRFREDLYYRVNVFPIEVPPLRERKSDIYVLSKSLTEQVCSEYGLAPKQLSAWALDKLLQYDWPGNIRELGNVIERAVVICDGSIIYPEFIDLEGVDDKADHPADMEWSTEGRSMREVMEYTEARTLRSAMARFDGDKRKAMEMLGMKKSAFYEKLQYYHIEG